MTKIVVTRLQPEPPNVWNMFDDPRWVWISHAADRAHGFYPNRMYHNQSFRLAAVVIDRKGNEFYLCTKALTYVIKATETGRIENGYAVLKERGLWRVIAFASTKQVWENVRGHSPHRGKHSDYWIIDESFQIAKPLLPF
jgi:hypothetical protein